MRADVRAAGISQSEPHGVNQSIWTRENSNARHIDQKTGENRMASTPTAPVAGWRTRCEIPSEFLGDPGALRWRKVDWSAGE